MRSGKRVLQILCFVCIFQVLLTIYLILKVYVSNVLRPDQLPRSEALQNNYENAEVYNAQDILLEENRNKFEEFLVSKPVERELLKDDEIEIVEVWGKAAIASYFWEHIFGGSKAVDIEDPSIYSGQLITKRCKLLYKEGPGLSLERLSHINVRILVLILNGRTEEKVSHSKEWLDHLKKLEQPPKVIVIMLGNEECLNRWVFEYMHPNGPVYGAFITYDDPDMDESSIFQWPLGVATYRHFPLLVLNDTTVSRPRQYLYNLQATNYENSTRNHLFSLLKSLSVSQNYSFVKERKQWKEAETPESLKDYLNALLHSDLTLCPAGFNTETYRVYEALSSGSVPVIEDINSGGLCDQSAGWRLLKDFNSPVIWIKDWSTLSDLLEKEANMSLKAKIRRRKKLLNWYEWFKLRNRDRFLSFLYNLIKQT